MLIPVPPDVLSRTARHLEVSEASPAPRAVSGLRVVKLRPHVGEPTDASETSRACRPTDERRMTVCSSGVVLARHFREAEGLSIAQIAERLGRSPATVKAYFYHSTGEKARAVKARYQGVCRGCGA